MPRAQSSVSSRSSETMTITSPTIPTKTAKDETIARVSQGEDDPSREFIELSNVAMELRKADMDASKVEAEMGKAEARVAHWYGITTIFLLFCVVVTAAIWGRKFVP